MKQCLSNKRKKPVGRKKELEYGCYSSSRGRGRGRGFKGNRPGRRGSGRRSILSEDESRQDMKHEYMEQMMVEEELKRKLEEQEWERSMDYFILKNFTQDDEYFVVEPMNRTKGSINLIINTKESIIREPLTTHDKEKPINQPYPKADIGKI
ncbi:hypothetical protein Tco_1124947 [Tanacetum coccineum]|uniref:Uncharacterized protein n=1 Tax=Tanacetum coccineum TaxID=301880 RepID=A0ABQ5J7K6_9ASTR